MKDSLSTSLFEIDEALTRLGSPLVENLRPGIPSATVEERLKSVGLASDPDLEVLLGWHDGTSWDDSATIGDAYLFPGFYLSPLDDSIENYLSRKSDKRWSKGWVPFMEDGGGDYFVVELRRRSWRTSVAEQPGRVRHFRNEEPEHPVEFSSIGAMFTTIAAAYDQGIFFMDEDGYLDMDYEKYARFAAALNPGIDVWTE